MQQPTNPEPHTNPNASTAAVSAVRPEIVAVAKLVTDAKNDPAIQSLMGPLATIFPENVRNISQHHLHVRNAVQAVLVLIGSVLGFVLGVSNTPGFCNLLGYIIPFLAASNYNPFLCGYAGYLSLGYIASWLSVGTFNLIYTIAYGDKEFFLTAQRRAELANRMRIPENALADEFSSIRAQLRSGPTTIAGARREDLIELLKAIMSSDDPEKIRAIYERHAAAFNTALETLRAQILSTPNPTPAGQTIALGAQQMPAQARSTPRGSAVFGSNLSGEVGRPASETTLRTAEGTDSPQSTAPGAAPAAPQNPVPPEDARAFFERILNTLTQMPTGSTRSQRTGSLQSAANVTAMQQQYESLAPYQRGLFARYSPRPAGVGLNPDQSSPRSNPATGVVGSRDALGSRLDLA